jgi:RNA polymerase sigma-54 factor
MASKSKLRLQIRQQSQLSPQQIMLMKLLHLPITALGERIQEELEANPALEEGIQDEYEGFETVENADGSEDLGESGEIGSTEDDGGRAEAGDGNGESTGTEDGIAGGDGESTGGEDGPEAEDAQYAGEWSDDQTDDYLDQGEQAPESDRPTDYARATGNFYDDLLQQWTLVAENEQEQRIGIHLIGNLDEDGYLRRPIFNLVDDLAIQEGLMAEQAEVELVLARIQTLEPPGIGARDLRECLLLQLRRRLENHVIRSPGSETMSSQENPVLDAIMLLEHYFDSYGQRQFERLASRLSWSTEKMRAARAEILHLNPRPGNSVSTPHEAPTAIPDFYVLLKDGQPELHLGDRSDNKSLRVSSYYREMLEEYDGRSRNAGIKEASTFIRSKIDQARWFIDALQQRRQTLRHTMQAIIDLQHEFFVSGNRARLKPMILKDVADRMGMDISTVSRVIHSKFVQTWFGNFPLKSFFSEGIALDGGGEASSIEVRQVLSEMIVAENKSKPLTDEAIMTALNARGFQLARRTVAKYREQLGIPVASLRKEY